MDDFSPSGDASYPPLSHSRLLRLKLDIASVPRLEAYARLYEHPHLPHLFPSLLVFLHQIMRSSVPLLELSRDQALQRAESDAVCAGIVHYLGTHLEEEKHHADWTLEDLEAIGLRREHVLARIPSSTVAALVGAQYYWVRHHHPLAVLGYLAALEGYPASEALLDRLQARSGLPAAAFRTCRVHVRYDPGHLRELDELLDGLPLQQQHHALLGVSCTHTAMMLAQGVQELLATVE